MNHAAELLPDEACRLRCVSVRQETGTAKSYGFSRVSGGPLAIQPGQFLNLIFSIDGEEVLRSYSVSSSVRSDRVTITVKRVAGGRVSNWLFDHLKPGDEVLCLGAAGVFTCGPAPTEPVLMLTAGSGITPAAAMLRSLADLGADADVVLVHFATSSEDMIFREEMAHWSRNLPKARIVPVVTRHAPLSGWVGVTGRLSQTLLQALVPDAAARTVLCCGPAGFMAEAGAIARSIGIPDARFITESFDSLPDDGEQAAPAADGFTISFAKSGKQAKCGPETTVLKAAKAAEVRVLSSCNKGVCGTCRIKLLSGTVEIKHQGGIRQREIDQGFILACCSRPTSDLVIDR